MTTIEHHDLGTNINNNYKNENLYNIIIEILSYCIVSQWHSPLMMKLNKMKLMTSLTPHFPYIITWDQQLQWVIVKPNLETWIYIELQYYEIVQQSLIARVDNVLWTSMCQHAQTHLWIVGKLDLSCPCDKLWQLSVVGSWQVHIPLLRIDGLNLNNSLSSPITNNIVIFLIPYGSHDVSRSHDFLSFMLAYSPIDQMAIDKCSTKRIHWKQEQPMPPSMALELGKVMTSPLIWDNKASHVFYIFNIYKRCGDVYSNTITLPLHSERLF